MRKRIVIVTLVVIMLFCVPQVYSSDLSKILEGLTKIQPLLLDNGKVGNLFSESIDKQYGVSTNAKEVNRLQNVGRKLVNANHLKPYDFQILNNFEFNACSIYGNKIRAFAGLMRDTQNSDAELAAVIAHEMAHQELGHNKKSVETFKMTYALDMAKIKLPKTLQLAANAVLAKRSRDDEEAADAKALNYLAKANMPLKGAIAVYRRIEAEHKIEQKKYGNNLSQQHFDQIFATHPDPNSRAVKAEDALFRQKYGETFREVKGVATGPTTGSKNSIAGNCPIILAHPSLWSSPIRIIDKLTGIGIFNPSPLSSEAIDVAYFLSLNMQGNHVAATCDNDAHGYLGKETNNHFTFIQSESIDAESLIEALQSGRTYASADGTEIKNMSFAIGNNFPKIRNVALSFSLADKFGHLTTPTVMMLRDGKFWQNCKADSKGNYSAIDNIDKGKHWYVIYIGGRLITSPITVNVTGDRRDQVVFNRDIPWQKGLIHYHSFYSDGVTKSIQKIWDSARRNGVSFMFMTDHADKFDEKKYQRYVGDCRRASSAMIPGVEYSIRNVKKLNHLLVLNRPDYLGYKEMSEEEFFSGKMKNAKKTLIIQGPFHLGDDFHGSEIEKDAAFEFGQTQATLKLRIKGSPFKDPILWINRHEIGRVVTTDNKWHWFEFSVDAKWLRNGQNLFHIESFIPDRWHTFDDCEVADIYISPR